MSRHRRLVTAQWCCAVVLVALAAIVMATRYRFQTPELWLPDLAVGLAAVSLAIAVWRGSRATSIWALVVADGWWAGTVWDYAHYWHRAALVMLVLAAPAIRPRSVVATVVAAAVAVATVLTPLWGSDAGTIVVSGVVLVAGVVEVRFRRRGRWLVPAVLLVVVLAGTAVADARRVPGDVTLLAYCLGLIVVLIAVGVLTRMPDGPSLADLAVDLGDAPVRDVATLTRMIRAEPGLDVDLIGAIASAEQREAANLAVRRELTAAVAEVSASRQRLVAAASEERARLAGELAFGTVVELERVAAEAEELAVAADLGRALSSLRAAVAGLRAPGLDGGVAAAVRDLPLVAELAASLDLSDARCPDVVEDTLFAVVAEGLANVAKYAAPCRVSVHFQVADGIAAVTVVDDGPGGARLGSGSGLLGLTDRVAALGGRLRVDSAVPTGTTLAATIPLTATSV